jgi:hypothetical protein
VKDDGYAPITASERASTADRAAPPVKAVASIGAKLHAKLLQPSHGFGGGRETAAKPCNFGQCETKRNHAETGLKPH